MAIFKANDKYRATLRATWIASPADTSISVTAVPDNVPTIITLGWETDLETTFTVTGKSGSTSADYALTGVTRLRGANTNLPENTAANCLNNEEFFNQYSSTVNDEFLNMEEQASAPATPASGFLRIYASTTGLWYYVDDTGAAAPLSEFLDEDTMATDSATKGASQQSIKAYVGKQTSTASSATPTPTGDSKQNELYITALAVAAEFAAPSGTPANGNKLTIRVLDDGSARALTYNAIYDGLFDTLPATTTISKTLYMGFIYNSEASKWEMVAYTEEG